MNPAISDETELITSLLESQFQIRGIISELVAYQDRNFLIIASSGEKYVLKINMHSHDLDFIRSQNRILAALSHKPAGEFLPCPITGINGELITDIYLDGQMAYARLFKFIDGEFLAESSPDISFYYKLGKVFAEIDRDMNGLEDPVMKSRTHEWDLARVMEVAEDINLINDPADRRLVHYFIMKYREEILPLYHKLPKGLIHSDGNDWNILLASKDPRPTLSRGQALRGDDSPRLRGDDKVGGVIDFGDMVYSARVNEVAIVLAYAMMGRDDYLDICREVINGYSSIIKLSVEELSVIYYLVAARWCQTMVMAARKENLNPGNAYHQVSVSGARTMLHKWVKVNPVEAVKILESTEIVNDEENVNKKNVSAILQSPDERINERYRYFSKAVSLSYQQPIHMAGAAMQYMYGADGETYLDCVNNIPHVGHCHPKVVEAAQRQMARLNTNTRYLYDSLDRYAEKLLSKFPPTLNKVFFVNSGSAATDLAVRLGEAHTGCCQYLVLDYAYHGNSKAAIGLSPYKFNRKGGHGKPDNVTILNLTNPPDNRQSQVAPTSPGNVTEAPGPPPGPPPDPLLRKEGEKSPLTFFAESIVGCAGQVVLSKELMQQTVTKVRQGGGIYVADEVQTGFGRVGQKFWAFELYDVVPDMVILGKPMGNGHPMGAVVCTESIAKSFETGMEFFSSFGGNPVSCEIGLAVLEIIEEERLQENARLVGDFLIGELRSLFSKESAVGSRQSAVGSGQSAVGSRQSAVGSRQWEVGSRQSAVGNRQWAGGRADQSPQFTNLQAEVRGSGLFLGIELIESETGQPATKEAGNIVNEMKERGFLLSTDGPFNNVIKFKPPMCFSLENARELLAELEEVLKGGGAPVGFRGKGGGPRLRGDDRKPFAGMTENLSSG
jgi:ethanolamine-phosphate phospho-lyase